MNADIQQISINDLHFDRKNPRLAEYGVTDESSESEIISILWNEMDIRELIQSICASGFFPHEPLIVSKENDNNIVIEGNRRLAALRIIFNTADVDVGSWPLPKLSKDALGKLEKIPVTILDRDKSWRQLGFKHINGPAKWSSYAKAQYIADVHRVYEIPLNDIANQIGDGHKTVQRLYRGFIVLEQAEEAKVYSRENRYKKRFAFSHLYTGLDYDGIKKFLSLESVEIEKTRPVPLGAQENLGKLCVWLYGDKKQGIPPVIQSQNPNLRQLDVILNHREALAALKAGESLDSSYQISRPSEGVFEDALFAAKRNLVRARSQLTTGYDGTKYLLNEAKSIADIASDVYSEMSRKHNSNEVPRTPKD